jgi:RHS repeat-associated protein
LYSGEQFDSKIGQQYLRARYYDPVTGRFNRLDPFFGNLNDPQSLHKYLYTHADPVNGIDPSGNSFVASISVSMNIGSNMQGNSARANMAGGARVVNFLHRLEDAYQMWEKVSSLYNTTKELLGLFSLDISDLMDISKLADFIKEDFLDKLKTQLKENNRVNVKLTVANLPNALCDKILTKVKAKNLNKNNTAQEIIGLLLSGFAMVSMKFSPCYFTYAYHGIDGVFRTPDSLGNKFVVLEAKGGSGRLIKVNNPDGPGQIRQMYDRWIRDRISKLNPIFMYDNTKNQLEKAAESHNKLTTSLFAMIVKADLRKGHYKFYLGAKSFPGINENSIDPLGKWGSPFE